MTREEEIKNKATAFADSLSDGLYYHSQQHKCREHGFIQGANWADKHPREGLWDAEKVIEWLKNNSSKYMNEGINYPHYAYNSLVDDLTKAMEGLNNDGKNTEN